MKLILFLICSMSLFSCVRAEKDKTTQVTLVFPHFAGQTSQNKVIPMSLNPNGTIIPNTLAEIECYGIIVSGPESSLRRNVCNYQNGKSENVGYFSGGYYAPTTDRPTKSVTLDIPSGVDRNIKLIGFKIDMTGASALLTPDLVCSKFFSKLNGFENYLSDPYQLAEVGSLLLPGGGSVDVPMTAVLDPTLKVGDCKGPDFPGGGGTGSTPAGPPVKVGVMFQDGIGVVGANKPLGNTSCVAVKLQLQDANGQRADVSANPLITSTIKTYFAPFTIGNFYNGETTAFCEGTPMSVDGSGDLTVSFHSGATAFTDLVMFFRPYANPSAPRTIQVDTSSGATLAQTIFNFEYTTTTPVAAKYGFLDLYNSVSSSSAKSLITRAAVQNNTCRFGVVQFLDTNGVPMGIVTPSVPNGISVQNSMGSNFSFYVSNSTCSINSGGSSIENLSFSGSSNYSGQGFYYKINSAFTGNFSFQIITVGSNTDIIPRASGDLSFGENFWKAIP